MRKTFSAVAAAATLFVGVLLVAPTASADSLPNGYSITCTPNGSGLICNISGCPRVFADEAGDVVHIRANGGPQDEVSKGCNTATTTTYPALANTTTTFSVQGCRKHDFPSTDDCGAWSDYKYNPPIQAPQAPAPVVSNAGQPMMCTGNNEPSYKLPSGSDCSKTPNPNPPPAPIADVTNAIQASFDQPGLGSVDFTVTNTSNLDATCHYTATANTLNPLVPKTTTRQFNVPANRSVVETFNGAPTFTKYDVTLSCSDASGKQKAELGHVVTSVLW